MLGWIDRRLREFKCVQLPFGGVNVYLSGDFVQLPAIGTPLYEKNSGNNNEAKSGAVA